MKKRKGGYEIFIILFCAVFVVSAFMFGKEVLHRQKAQKDFVYLAEYVMAETTETEVKPAQKRNITGLQEQNPECAGWICIPESTIDYPVMHTPSYPQKYLRKNFEEEYSIPGVPFLDYGCTLDSGNLIIYGHNMNNGTMFSDLCKYLDEEFRDSHQTIEFETAEGCSYYTVTDVREVHQTDDWYANLNPSDGKQYLTLSTCYGASDERLIVIAQKIK